MRRAVAEIAGDVDRRDAGCGATLPRRSRRRSRLPSASRSPVRRARGSKSEGGETGGAQSPPRRRRVRGSRSSRSRRRPRRGRRRRAKPSPGSSGRGRRAPATVVPSASLGRRWPRAGSPCRRPPCTSATRRRRRSRDRAIAGARPKAAGRGRGRSAARRRRASGSIRRHGVSSSGGGSASACEVELIGGERARDGVDGRPGARRSRRRRTFGLKRSPPRRSTSRLRRRPGPCRDSEMESPSGNGAPSPPSSRLSALSERMSALSVPAKLVSPAPPQTPSADSVERPRGDAQRDAGGAAAQRVARIVDAAVDGDVLVPPGADQRRRAAARRRAASRGRRRGFRSACRDGARR